MTTPPEIQEFLRGLGLAENEISQAEADLRKLILVRITEKAMQRSDPQVVAHLNALTPEAAGVYLTEHPDALAKLSSEEANEVIGDTLKEYQKHMSV